MFLLPFPPHGFPCDPFQFLEDLNAEDCFIPHLSKAGMCFPCDGASIAFSSSDCAHDLGLLRIPLHPTQSAHKGVALGRLW